MADPLRSIKKDGSPYRRRRDVEMQIDSLLQLPLEDVARRAQDEGLTSPKFVTTEAVLYFVRQKRADHKPLVLKSLYGTLRHRIRSLHRSAPRTAGALTLAEAEELLLYRMTELLCLDRERYEEGLDYFECMFNSALFTHRINAMRDVKRKMPKNPEPLELEGETVPSPEIELRLARLAGQSPDDEREKEYRLRILEVISELPDELKRVIEMHYLRGIPMDSPNRGAPCIASILGIGEQTVRKRKKLALLAIREGLAREERREQF